MIDIASLVTNTWAALQPYLPILRTKLSDEIMARVPEVVGMVWKVIKEKFETKPAAKEALDDVLNTPDDPDAQAAFRQQLKKVATEDESFAAAISELLTTAGDSYKANLSGGGAIAQGRGAKAVGQGGVMVGGNASGNIIVGNDNSSNNEK